MINSSFITPEIVTQKREQYLFKRLFDGNIGSDYDNIGHLNKSRRSETALYRLDSTLKRKKKDWTNNICMTTNYVKAISNIYSTFVLGEGVKFSFPNNDGEDFLKWWASNKMDSLIEKSHKISMVTGYDGMCIFLKNGSPTPGLFGFEEFYPEYHPVFGNSSDEGHLMWTLRDVFEQGDEYYYVKSILKEGAFYKIYHTCYEAKNLKTFSSLRYNLTKHTKIEALFEFGKSRPDVLDKLGFSGLNSDGSDPASYKTNPLHILHSQDMGDDLLGLPMFKDILPHIQALYFLDTLLLLESEAHMLSKIAIPSSMIPEAEDGLPDISNMEFIEFEDNGQLPQFIVKDFDSDYVFKQKEKILDQISLITSTPIELLSGEGKGGNEKVDLVKIKQKPFEKSIKSQQKMLKEYIQNIYDMYHEITGETAPEMVITLPPLFDEPVIELMELRQKEYELGLIGINHYHKEVRDKNTSSERDSIVKEAEQLQEKRKAEAVELSEANKFGGASGRDNIGKENQNKTINNK